jgi:iron complex transport system substrate-binding protein
MSPTPRNCRRVFAATTVTSALVLALSACSSEDTDDSSGADTAKISLHNAFEDAEYPVAPERVVVTASAVDNVLALGVTPTAVIMTSQDGDAPWRGDKLDGVDKIDVANYGDLNLESIADAAPDVIIGDAYWIDTREEYDSLSAIAPTLNGPTAEPWTVDWHDMITQLGELFGRTGDADRVIREDTALFDRTRTELPELAGKTGWIGRSLGDGKIGISPDPEEGSNAFLRDLGMTLPDTILGQKANDAAGVFSAAPENYDLIAADFSVLYAAEGIDSLMKQPTFNDLPQVKQGTLVAGDYATTIGLAQPNSLSRAWALDNLRPELKKVAKEAD